MALDSKGNPAVDFAWGNFPMQPNTDRGGEALVTYDIVEADQKDGVQRFVFSTEPAVGAEFEVVINPSWVGGGSGGSSAGLAGKYTVSSVELSPTGFFVKTTSSYKNTAYGNVNSLLGTATVDPGKNYGGGAGDVSWSKTTKKKAALLDPALDGHNILDLGWNGYPGYTPGVSQPPFEAFSFSPINGGNWYLEAGRYNFTSPTEPAFYEGNGFLFSINDADSVLGAQWADIQERVDNNKLIGAQLTYSGVQTMYGDLPGAGQKFDIIAAWYAADGAYGNTNLYIKTAPAEVNGIDMPPYSSSDGYLSSYVTFAVTGGTKSGVEIAKITDSMGLNVGLSPNWMTYEHAWMIPTALLTPAETALLLDTATVGKFMATSHITNDPMHMEAQTTKKWCDQITSVGQYTDSYGTDFIKVFFNAQGENGTGFMDLTVIGERLVILN